MRQYFRRLPFDNLLGQPFGNGGFANTGIAHQKGVVLAPAAQNLNATLHFRSAANQRIHFALARFGVQVDAEFAQCRFLGLFIAAGGSGLFFIRAGNGARFGKAGILGNTMGNEIHRIIARHILFLQEIGRVRFAFGENCHKHIRACHFISARTLDMDCRALDNALESGRWHSFGPFNIGHQRCQFFFDEIIEGLSKLLQIDIAGLQHAAGIRFVNQ